MGAFLIYFSNVDSCYNGDLYGEIEYSPNLLSLSANSRSSRDEKCNFRIIYDKSITYNFAGGLHMEVQPIRQLPG